jgi:hypothetical protein
MRSARSRCFVTSRNRAEHAKMTRAVTRGQFKDFRPTRLEYLEGHQSNDGDAAGISPKQIHEVSACVSVSSRSPEKARFHERSVMEAAGVEPGHHASYQELTAFRFLLIRSIRSNGPVDTRITHTDGPPTRLSSLVRLESGNSTRYSGVIA